MRTSIVQLTSLLVLLTYINVQSESLDVINLLDNEHTSFSLGSFSSSSSSFTPSRLRHPSSSSSDSSSVSFTKDETNTVTSSLSSSSSSSLSIAPNRKLATTDSVITAVDPFMCLLSNNTYQVPLVFSRFSPTGTYNPYIAVRVSLDLSATEQYPNGFLEPFDTLVTWGVSGFLARDTGLKDAWLSLNLPFLDNIDPANMNGQSYVDITLNIAAESDTCTVNASTLQITIRIANEISGDCSLVTNNNNLITYDSSDMIYIEDYLTSIPLQFTRSVFMYPGASVAGGQVLLRANAGSYNLTANGNYEFFRLGITIPANQVGVLMVQYPLPSMFAGIDSTDSSFIFQGRMYPYRSFFGTRYNSSPFRILAFRADANLSLVPIPSQIKYYPGGSPNYFALINPVDNNRCAPAVYTAVITPGTMNATTPVTFTVNRVVTSLGFVGGIGVYVRFTMDPLPFNLTVGTIFRFPSEPLPLFWNSGDSQSRTFKLFYNSNPWTMLVPENVNLTSFCGTLQLENALGVSMVTTSTIANGFDVWNNRIRVCIAASSSVASAITTEESQKAVYGSTCTYPSPTPTPSVTPSSSSSPSITSTGTGTPTPSYIFPTRTPSTTPSIALANFKISSVLNSIGDEYPFVLSPQPYRRSPSSRARTAATVTIPRPLYTYLYAMAETNTVDYSFLSPTNMSLWYASWAGLGENYTEFYDGNDIEASLSLSNYSSVRSATFTDTGSDLYIYPDIWVAQSDAAIAGTGRSRRVYRSIPIVGTSCQEIPGLILSGVRVNICPMTVSYRFIGIPTYANYTAGAFSSVNPHILTITTDLRSPSYTKYGAVRVPRGSLYPGFVYAIVPVWSNGGFDMTGYNPINGLMGNQSISIKNRFTKPTFIYVNRPPFNGTVTSTPSNGTIDTVFTFTAGNWMDDTPDTLRPNNELATDLNFELLFSHPLLNVPNTDDTLSVITRNSYCSAEQIVAAASLSTSAIDSATLQARFWANTLQHLAIMMDATVQDMCTFYLSRSYQLWQPDITTGNRYNFTFHANADGSVTSSVSPIVNPVTAAEQINLYSLSSSWEGVPLDISSSSGSLATQLPSGSAEAKFSVAVYVFIQDEDGGVTVTTQSVTVNKLMISGTAAIEYVDNFLSGITNSTPVSTILLAIGDITELLVSNDTTLTNETAARANVKEGVANVLSNVLDRLLSSQPDTGLPRVSDGTATVLTSSLGVLTSNPAEITSATANTAFSTITRLMDACAPSGIPTSAVPAALPLSIAETALGVVTNVLSSEIFTQADNATNTSSYEGSTSQYRDATHNAVSAMSRAILRDATGGSAARSILAVPANGETTDPVTGCQPSLALTVARLSSTGPVTSINTANAPCGGNPDPVTVPKVEFSANQIVDSSIVDVSKGIDIQILSFGNTPMTEQAGWGNLNSGSTFGSARRRRLGVMEGPTGSEGKSIDLLPTAGLDSNVLSIKLQKPNGEPITVKNSSTPFLIKLPVRTRSNATERSSMIDYDPPSFNVTCPSMNDAILPSGTFLPVTRWYPNGLTSSNTAQAEILSYTNTTYQVPVYWRTTGTKDRLPNVFGSKRTTRRDPLGQITGYTMVTVPVYTISVDCGGAVGKQTFSCGSDPAVDTGPRNITFDCPITRVQPTCAFWNDTTATWSDNGCTVVEATDEYVLCSCNHLTEFGARFSALADQQQDMFAMNDLLSDPDVLNQYPYVFILIGVIGATVLLLSFVTLYLDSQGDARYFKLLTLDEEVQTLRIIEEAKGHHFILDRAIDRKYAAMNVSQKAKFGRLTRTEVTQAKTVDGSSGNGMLSSLMGGSMLGTGTPVAENTSSGKGRDSLIPVEAGDPVVIDPSTTSGSDPYATGLYLKVVDSFDRQKVSLNRLREEITGIKGPTPGGTGNISTIQNPMANTARLMDAGGKDNDANNNLFQSAAKPEVIEKARAKLAKLSKASSWTCVRMWSLRAFILRTWFTMIWTKHPYFAIFTRHDSRSSRTQRLLVIAANLLTNLFATAFWFAWRNEEGDNPDLPEMDETELLVCAGLATAMQLPINMLVEYLMESAGEANFKQRYPFLAAELDRRKRMQARLSKLSRPLLEAEVAKFQTKLDNLHDETHHHHHHHQGTSTGATIPHPGSLSPVSPGREAYATLSHFTKRPTDEAMPTAPLPTGLSMFAAAKAVRAFKRAGTKAKEKVKARKIEIEEDPFDVDDGFDYGWVDAPPSCQDYCGCFLRILGRHPSQKGAYVSRKRDHQRKRYERTKALADARSEARRVVEEQKEERKREKMEKKRSLYAKPSVSALTGGQSSVALALKDTQENVTNNEKITVIAADNSTTDATQNPTAVSPTKPKRKLKIVDKHAVQFGLKRGSTGAASANTEEVQSGDTTTTSTTKPTDDVSKPSDDSSAVQGTQESSDNPILPTIVPLPKPSLTIPPVPVSAIAMVSVSAIAMVPPSLTPSTSPPPLLDDSDSDSSSDYDSSSDDEDEEAEDVDTGFLEDLLSAGDSGERLFIILQGTFSCLFSGVLYVYHIFKPLPPPPSADEVLAKTIEKIKEKKQQRAEQKAELARMTSNHHVAHHSSHHEFDNTHPTTKKSALNNLMNKDPTKQKCWGFTKEGVFGYAVTLAWMGFCLYYVLLFGLYQGEEATYSFMQDWAISQAFASFGLAPIAFLLVILWMYVIWPTWLPFLIWVPGLGKVLASREARAINASDGSASLSGRMEHLTLVRAAGYASMLSPQTAILAYGASAAVAVAYGGIASAISKITGRAASKKAQLKGKAQNTTVTDDSIAKEKELTNEQRNELIIRRYLLEQIILVEKARRKLDHQQRHRQHNSNSSSSSLSLRSSSVSSIAITDLQEHQKQRLNQLTPQSTSAV